MVVNSITVYTYLNKCPIRYNQINWRPSWYVFLRIQNKEIRETEFHKFFKKQTLSKVLAWYDTQILQQIGIASKTTLEVRIRIVCGTVNKLPIEVLTRDLKIEFMECIWDTFRKFYDEWNEWYCRYILQLPFQGYSHWVDYNPH